MSRTEEEGLSSYRTLRVVQLALGAVVLSLLLVGRSERFFPITGWPLYESIIIPRPDASVNVVYLRVSMHDGTARELPADRLVEHSRGGMIKFTIDGATQREDSPSRTAARKHLALLIALKLGTTAFDSVRVSQRVWAVDLERVPPVNVSRPVTTVPVADFAVPP